MGVATNIYVPIFEIVFPQGNHQYIFGNNMSCTLPEKSDFSEPLISKANWGSGTRVTQHETL